MLKARALYSSGAFRKPPAPSIPCTRLPGAAAAAGNEGEVMANDVSTLTAQKRDQAGKGPSHRLRAKGLIPAACYGPYDDAQHGAVDAEGIKKATLPPPKFHTG